MSELNNASEQGWQKRFDITIGANSTYALWWDYQKHRLTAW